MLHSTLEPVFQLRENGYWLLLIYMIGCGLLVHMLPKKTMLIDGRPEQRWYWVSVLLLVIPYILWAGYRASVGDTYAYSRSFSIAPSSLSELLNTLDPNGKDPGYNVLVTLFKMLGVKNSRTFLLLIAALQILCMSYTFRKYSPNFWISFFLFIASTDYISWTFNGLRQFIAVCIIFAAFGLLLEKRYVWYALVVFLAAQIHGSAILMLPLAFIMQGKALNQKTLMLTFATVLFLPFGSKFLPIMTELLEDTQYGSSMADDAWLRDDGTSMLRVLVYSIPALIAILRYKYVRQSKNHVMNLCINASVITMALYLVSAVTSGVYMGRLPIYTTFQGYIALPWLIDQSFEKQSAMLIKLLLVVCYCVFFYYQMAIAWGIM